MDIAISMSELLAVTIISLILGVFVGYACYIASSYDRRNFLLGTIIMIGIVLGIYGIIVLVRWVWIL